VFVSVLVWMSDESLERITGGANLRGEGRCCKRRGYGVNNGGWGHVVFRVNAESITAKRFINDRLFVMEKK